ncbi:hypothetical protein [Yoonia sp. SS1-5]|uniref:Flagellar FliJ protein n=1 Tax=Yoonia rhodophyticola TaxID=3137370 RepID=A0AAN0NJ55_9RHOB
MGEVAKLRLQVVQAEMNDLVNQANGLRRNLDQLVESKHALARADRQTDDPALAAGADIRWQKWADQRRAAINTELAQVMARQDVCRRRLKHAFGQDQAADQLLAQQIVEEQVRRRRKIDYES